MRGTYNKVSANDRVRILKAHEEERDWRQTAQALGVNVRTAYEWIKKCQPLPKPRGGNVKTKKTPEIEVALVRWIEANPTLTLQNLKEQLITDFEIVVSINTIKNWLDGQLFSLKLLRPTVGNMNAIINKEKRREYVEKVLESRANGRTLIWVDESNFNMYTRRKEGRSKIGQRATIIMPTSKGSNLHCIGTMTSNKLISFEHRRGSYKAVDCKEWLRRIIGICEDEGLQQPTFIIDNAPAHSNLEEAILPDEDVQVVRLAPYSYLLNPIELMWSFFKSSVKSQLRNRMPNILNYNRLNNNMPTICEHRMRILEEIADSAINEVTSHHLTQYSNHVERYYASALREEDLIEIN